MPLPTNYMIPKTDPLTGFTGAFNLGSGMRQVGITQDAQEQQLAKQEQKNALFAKLQSPTATGEDFRNAALASDEKQSKAIMEVFAARTTEQNNASLSRSGRTLYAYKNGNTAMGEKLLNTQIEAQRNSGNEEGAKYLETMLSISKESPDAFINMLSANMAMMPGGTEAIDAVNKIAIESREAGMHIEEVKKVQAETGLKDAQVQEAIQKTEKLDAETQKLNLEMLAAGTPDPKQRFDMETKLNEKYTARTKDFTASKSDYQKMKDSAKEDTGPGDVALIFSFMKMLDPGSVVRESEFAIAQNSGGLLESLVVSYAKAKDGDRLTSKQRSNFLVLAKKYMTASSKHEAAVRGDLQNMVDDYELNGKNVFGNAQAREDTANEDETPPPVKVVSVDF